MGLFTVSLRYDDISSNNTRFARICSLGRSKYEISETFTVAHLTQSYHHLHKQLSMKILCYIVNFRQKRMLSIRDSQIEKMKKVLNLGEVFLFLLKLLAQEFSLLLLTHTSLSSLGANCMKLTLSSAKLHCISIGADFFLSITAQGRGSRIG